MGRQYYALIGHCKMERGLQQGISVCRYEPESAEMRPLGCYEQDLRVGCQTYDPRRNRLYVVDEFWSLPGQTGGGGRVASLVLGKDGGLRRTGIQQTFGTNPSYLAVDKTGNYLLVTHHCTENFVTRMTSTETGRRGEVCYDDCTLLLCRLTETGEVGEIADVVHIPGYDQDGAHRFPHLHCVVPNHSRNFFVVCDKGLDKIYSYKINYAEEKLVKCCEMDAKPHSEPRYCCFHPSKPVFYCNNESSVDIDWYEMDGATGAFRFLGSQVSVSGASAEDVSPSDIVIHPSGRYIFTSLRRKNLISVMEVADDAALVHKQTLSSGGVNPRGLCVSPDGRFLLAANMQSGSVQTFAIGEDGCLTAVCGTETGGYPGNIQIISLQGGTE